MYRFTCLALVMVLGVLQITPTLAEDDEISRHEHAPEEENVDGVKGKNLGGDDGSVGGFGEGGNGDVKDRQDVSSCQLTKDGFFGDSGTPEEVDYYYELVLAPDVDVRTTNTDVLPALERGFANALIPDLFPEANCDEEEERRSLSIIPHSRRTKVIGISMRAVDVVLEGVPCAAPSDNCVVVDGQLRIFTDMYEAQTKLLGLDNPTPELILQALVLKAKEGAFDDLHPAVEKITVLSEAPPSVAATNGESEDDGDNNGNLQGNGDGGNKLALGLSLAVVAALLVAAAAVTYKRRQRNNEQDELESYQQVEEINSLAPPPSSVV